MIGRPRIGTGGRARFALLKAGTRHRGHGTWHVVATAGEPSYQNSWVEDQPALQCSFLIDDSGLVHLVMNAKRLGGGTGGVIFTLPVGFRPTEPMAFGTAQVRMSFVGSPRAGVLHIGTNGEVRAEAAVLEVRSADLRFRAAA